MDYSVNSRNIQQLKRILKSIQEIFNNKKDIKVNLFNHHCSKSLSIIFDIIESEILSTISAQNNS